MVDPLAIAIAEDPDGVLLRYTLTEQITTTDGHLLERSWEVLPPTKYLGDGEGLARVQGKLLRLTSDQLVRFEAALDHVVAANETERERGHD